MPSRKATSARAKSPALVGIADLFKIGIGPSSSHTMGPMVAAKRFVTGLGDHMATTRRIVATAYGSLAWTGKGHWTDKAMILGLAGEQPDRLTPARAHEVLASIRQTRSLAMPDGRSIPFDPEEDVVFDKVTRFGRHPNAMAFEALAADGASLVREVWYSIGGGFVERDGDARGRQEDCVQPRHALASADELLELCRTSGLSLVEVALANEACRRPEADTLAVIDTIARVMLECIECGLSTDGELPGGLKVKRRAKGLFDQLQANRRHNTTIPDEAMRYVAAYAIAVNEENAAGNRIVTAPTNGAAGVIPAVLRYYRDFCASESAGGEPGVACRDGFRSFFLAATLIGAIIKRNASISGAEVGCQGEVGSAAAMAAAGLTAALGGTTEQIENAAEIAIEHHLGMTCDPVGGLVQIPCIERNAFGAIKAIAASSLALQGDGTHRVSLDQAIETMRQTGLDMKSKYRETSRGGLAVNVPEC